MNVRKELDLRHKFHGYSVYIRTLNKKHQGYD